MKILIVEDEAKVRIYLEEFFRKNHFEVESCTSSNEFSSFLNERPALPPDLIILDRLLGAEDAGEMIPQIKDSYPQTKILILSAIGTGVDKGRFLDLGADDYLSKPFSIEELGARIRALTRRHSEGQSNILLQGNLNLSLLNHSATVGQKKLDVSRKEYLLLKTFMENPCKVFNKFNLLDLVWDASPEIESNVVEVTVMNLRKKLERAGATCKIMSKRNIGYWLEV